MRSSAQKIINLMFDELRRSKPIYHPSRLWQDLNKTHINQLATYGYQNFKRTVNLHYFNWRIPGIISHQAHIILQEFVKGNFSPLLASRIVDNKSKDKLVPQYLNVFTQVLYKTYIAAFFDYLVPFDLLRLLSRFGEPVSGNPTIVQYKGKHLSQDLLNSIHEFYTITDHVNLNLKPNARIAEIGAGYGRLAYVFLKAMPRVSYFIIDIPPALYLSQRYIATLFLKRRIFHWRPFTPSQKIYKELMAADIVFLQPQQAECLPRKFFDLVITISSLHEMTRMQISHYFKMVDSLSKGYFYTKQWQRALTKDNAYITQLEYPIPHNWKEILLRNPHPVQKKFFDAIYQIL